MSKEVSIIELLEEISKKVVDLHERVKKLEETNQ